jgi:hypothetical protein
MTGGGSSRAASGGLGDSQPLCFVMVTCVAFSPATQSLHR